jgi:hypothetical protein
MTKIVSVEHIKPGMILKAKTANGSRYRKVYKTEYWTHHTFIWSIIVRFDPKKGEWVEECSMVSNEISKISHIADIVDGKVVDTKVEIIK